MERSSAAALAAAAAASLAAFLVLRRKSKPCKDAQGRTRKDAPVLCFGDSLTEGYHGVWIHPTYSPPSNPNDPAKETEAMKLHPYALRLGDRLADQAGDDTPQRRARYACCRAWKPGQKFVEPTSTRAYAIRAETDARVRDRSRDPSRKFPRRWNGWTAEDLKPMLARELRAGPWRCAVILAGSNDVVFGAAPDVALERIRALWRMCDAAGVPVVVVANPPADLTHHGWVTKGGTDFSCAAARTAAMAALGATVEQAAAGRPTVAAMPQDDAHAAHWDDCLHFSPAGSDALGDRVFAAIAAAGL